MDSSAPQGMAETPAPTPRGGKRKSFVSTSDGSVSGTIVWRTTTTTENDPLHEISDRLLRVKESFAYVVEHYVIVEVVTSNVCCLL